MSYLVENVESTSLDLEDGVGDKFLFGRDLICCLVFEFSLPFFPFLQISSTNYVGHYSHNVRFLFFFSSKIIMYTQRGMLARIRKHAAHPIAFEKVRAA